MKVGVIGLGGMGSGMAASLLRAGHEVVVWNRSPAPAEALERQGARRARKLPEALQGDVAVTMLPTDDAVRDVIVRPGALAKAASGLVHVVSSTISVAFSRDLQKAHRAAEVAYVAAPVLGRPDVAEKGELNVLAAGPADALSKAAPVLDALGKRTWPLGDEPHLANVAKLAVNFMLASAIETMAEAFTLGEKHGIDPHVLLDLVTGTLFAAPAYKTYGAFVADRQFEPANFKLTLGLKDVRQAQQAGEAVGAPMPIASLIRDNFIDAVAHGDGEKDWAALASVAIRRAGLPR
jgi:3-hydroxyisobutyrate dehydrogenase-like beta-hydroxyacid dehydrogenase